MAKTNTRYTYVDFANEVIEMVTNTDCGAKGVRMIEKAQALIATQESKKAYNTNNPKKSTAKGASEITKQNGALIATVLADSEKGAKTAAEINEVLSTEFTALQVANAIKFLDGAQSCKVIRETINGKGLKAQKEYTAYFKA